MAQKLTNKLGGQQMEATFLFSISFSCLMLKVVQAGTGAVTVNLRMLRSKKKEKKKVVFVSKGMDASNRRKQIEIVPHLLLNKNLILILVLDV